MNIQFNAPSFTGNVTYRIAKQNQKNLNLPPLENRVLKILREQKLPAIVKNSHVDVTFDEKYQRKEIQEFKNAANNAGINLQVLA